MKTLTLTILTMLTAGASAQQAMIITNTSNLKFVKVDFPEPVINQDSLQIFKLRQAYAKGCVNLAPHSMDPRACDSLAKYNDLYEPYAADKGNVAYTRAVCKYKNLNTMIIEGMMDNGSSTSAEYFASLKPANRQMILNSVQATKSSLEAYMAKYSLLNDYTTQNSRKWMTECDGYISELSK